MLTFDPDSHTYTVEGRPVPSVTQVIGEWSRLSFSYMNYYFNNFTGAVVSAEKFESGADYGTAIHQACRLILEAGHDNLDWKALAPELILPVQQFEKWLEDWSPDILLIEEPMYSSKYGYAGTSDIVATIQKRDTVVDIKTGAFDMAGPQVVAYGQLYKEEFKYRKTPGRYVLHLPKDGGEYKFIPLTNKMDWDFFRSRLFQYQYLNQ